MPGSTDWEKGSTDQDTNLQNLIKAQKPALSPSSD